MKLLITLGHNSSAILVNHNAVLIGYEEERLSGVKSDSAFPTLSLNKILEYHPEAYEEVTEILISHWFWDFDLEENKYYNPKYLAVNFPNGKIESLNKDFTHHDAHANSVWNFCEGDDSGFTIVADGFGNFGECISVYEDGLLLDRTYDLNNSLGLMYQYAIGYLGMKENQDEYKLLGYEQQVDKGFKDLIKPEVIKQGEIMFEDFIFDDSFPQELDMSVALSAVRNKWYNLFEAIDNGEKSRSKIAYYVQGIVEYFFERLIRHYEAKNVKVSGGVFYNVKLNNMILRMVDKFEANPLAGDQGCALGMTKVRYEDLYWGKRNVTKPPMISEIETKGYTEVLVGKMEFGPRALGNTTTLALPTMALVEKINEENGRDTTMPMAPMVTEKFMNENFVDVDKVGKSKRFMIIAFDYKTMTDDIRGAAHYDSDRDVYTGRFQLAPEHLKKIVEQYNGILINTSLNAHGQPILYDNKSYKRMKQIQQKVKDNK